MHEVLVNRLGGLSLPRKSVVRLTDRPDIQQQQLRFVDDIDALAEEEQEQEALVESLDKTCTRFKMEISAEKTKLMTNSANGIQRER